MQCEIEPQEAGMKFAKLAKELMAIALCGTMLWTACSTAWVSEAEQIVAVLIPAMANIVTLVATLQGSVSAADLQTVQSAGSQTGADLQLLQSLIAQYQKADAGVQPGVLNQIQADISAVESNLNGLLPALHIKDAATQAKVAAVVGILLSEVQSVAAIVPLARPNASAGMQKLAEKQIRKQAPLTANEFVGSYNATMTAKTGKAELDHATSGLRIHLHERAVRWASAGLLK
jgi:hypothetical protein